MGSGSQAPEGRARARGGGLMSARLEKQSPGGNPGSCGRSERLGRILSNVGPEGVPVRRCFLRAAAVGVAEPFHFTRGQDGLDVGPEAAARSLRAVWDRLDDEDRGIVAAVLARMEARA